MVEVKRQWPHLSGTLLLASGASIGLFVAGAVRNRNYDYNYMIWNLFLAWLPLLLIIWLQRTLQNKRWSSWQGITISLLWLGFLPNSFYMVTDYIHLLDAPRVDILFDAIMLTAFAVTGLALGYISLYLFHVELRKRIPSGSAARVVALVLLLCSFAIYLGRDLRWNTWDLFVNPAGILFDVSDRLISPQAHPQMFVTILSVLVLLSIFYLLIWNVIRTLRPSPRR